MSWTSHLAVVALFLVTTVASAADEPATVAAPKAPRLPNLFGQIGLSDEQKAEVAAVQTRSAGAIDQLEQQLTDLKAKRDAEIEALLTVKQRKQLKDLRAAALAKQTIKKQSKPAVNKPSTPATTPPVK